MKPENLKKILHNRNKIKHENSYIKENKLNLTYVKINDLKNTKKATAFNMVRNKAIDNQLNKYGSIIFPVDDLSI